MNLDIITVGSVGFDIFISGKSIKPSLMSKDDSITLQSGAQYQVDHSVYEAGGPGLNSAICFARQGIKTGCIARTGKDHLANQIKIILKHEGIEHELLINNPEHHTDLDIHIVTERAQDIDLSYKNSVNSLRGHDVRFPGLTARALYLAELPVDFKLFKFFVEWAKSCGASLIANVTSTSGYKTKQMNYALSRLTSMMMPIDFASSFFDGVSDSAEIIRQLSALGSKSVLLYDVSKESYAFHDQTMYSCGTYKKVNPLDMTGANDIFAASYASAIFQQKTVPEALTFASANACSVLEVFGTRAGVLRKPALRTIKVETGVL